MPTKATTRTKAASAKSGATKRTATKATATELDPRFAPIVEAFARDRAVTTGGMFGNVSLKVNGKVFAMVVKGMLVTKLPRARVDALVAAGEGVYFDPGHGRLMKEWIAVPPGDALWRALAEESHRFVKQARR